MRRQDLECILHNHPTKGMLSATLTQLLMPWGPHVRNRIHCSGAKCMLHAINLLYNKNIIQNLRK